MSDIPTPHQLSELMHQELLEQLRNLEDKVEALRDAITYFIDRVTTTPSSSHSHTFSDDE